VPAAAIQQGAQGAFVYVIKDDKTAAVVPVKLGSGDATTAVVISGVQPGARVVVEGADRLRAGSVVNATTSAEPAASATTAPECQGDAAHPQPQTPNAHS